MHSFEEDYAVKYGVESAIMIQNFKFWLAKNKANNKHFYEGRYWTYNSIKAFSELFPYWSDKQIRRILDSLEKNNILIVGNFNKSNYDRTKWYSLNIDYSDTKPQQNSTCPNGQMDLTKWANGFDQMGEPIPDINTDINTDIISFDDFWNLYDKKVGLTKCKQKWDKLSNADKQMIINYIPKYKIAQPDKRYRKNPETFFNNRSWEDELISDKVVKTSGDKGTKDNPKHYKDSDLVKDDWVICEHKTIGKYLAQVDYLLPGGIPSFKNKQLTVEQLNKLK